MKTLHPRIRTALVSVNPTSKTPAWHGAPTALGVLRGVSPAVAVWRPYPGCNNIREIALHIAFYENSIASRLSGEKVSLRFKQWKSGWVVRLDAVDAQQWKAELDIVKAAHQRLVDALTSLNPDLLDQPGGAETKRPLIEYIHGVAEHSVLHAAQMDMLKSMAKHAGVE
jgi:uncharacterized damage-inducible protein DinB